MMIVMAKIAQIKADLFALAKRFCGQWVALDPNTSDIVASAGTAKEVLELAEREGCAEPLVFKVLDNYGPLAPCHVG